LCMAPSRIRGRAGVLPLALGLALMAGACAPNMSKQPRNKPLSESDFFTDGRSARMPVEGTVARGMLRADERLYTGKANGLFAGNLPLPVTGELLSRGRERFDIYCSPCHGRVGDGSGMIVQRGLRRPPSYHIDRLREVPDGYLFDVITNGFGAMPGYASRIGVQDRWAITAYIRALQLSHASKLEDVPAAERPKLLEATK
jgi:mono/diheme cytochrome c family protein